MPRESYRDKAVVIRTYDFGEADRVIVLLTRAHGLVRGVAKGVRRAKSRFGSRLQQFVALDVQLYAGRGLDTITSADTVEYFGSGIIDNYEAYTAACAVLETAQRLVHTDAEPDPYYFDSVTHAFRRLQLAAASDSAYSAPSHQAVHPIVDAFSLQAFAHAGWAPSLFNCASCGATGPHRAFHPAVGGAAEVDPETLHLMWLYLGDYMDAARNLISSRPELVSEAHRLTIAHIQWHLERKVTALNLRD